MRLHLLREIKGNAVPLLKQLNISPVGLNKS
jgi:hypothetical protein